MRKCIKCGEEKPETNEYFSKRTKGKNGLRAICKECCREYCKQWHKENKEHEKQYYEANKEAIAKYRKQWYENNPGYSKNHYKKNKEAYIVKSKQWCKDNPELMDQYRIKWKAANPERAKEVQRRYRQNNPDKRAASCKKYLESHPAERSASNRKWAQNNPDNRKVSAQRRLTRKKSLPSTLTTEQWTAVKEEFGGTCCYCGKEKPLTIDHFVPVNNMGELSIDNVLPACISCNCSKGAREFRAWFKLQTFYSKSREQKIMKYLNYKNETQQFSLAF